MSWRVVVVTGNAKIDYKMDYLAVRTLDDMRRIHISEIGVLMLEKRIQTKAINVLIKHAREQLSKEIHNLSFEIRLFLSKFANLADFPASYDDTENLSELLKAFNFHVETENLPACEALYEQMNIIHQLYDKQVFVLANAKAYFAEEELRKL